MWSMGVGLVILEGATMNDDHEAQALALVSLRRMPFQAPLFDCWMFLAQLFVFNGPRWKCFELSLLHNPAHLWNVW